MKKKCEHPDCENEVEDEDVCHGCGGYVCDEHCMCSPPQGHLPEAHWDVCDVCGEHVDVCSCDED